MNERDKKYRKDFERRQKSTGKRSEILEKIRIALNADDVGAVSKLVESEFDDGYTAEEIKEAARLCMAHPNFDVIYEFCRAMHFEENRRTKRG